MSSYTVFLVLASVLIGCCSSTRSSYNNVCKKTIVKPCVQTIGQWYLCTRGQTNSGSQAEIYSFNSRWNRFRRWCFRTIKKTFICKHQIRFCCPGWKKDNWNKCTIKAVMEECYGGCGNGGTCFGGKCLCPVGFTGNRCEEALCAPDCENGGVCTSMQGHPRCSCPKAFKGVACEQAVCEPKCLNGGLCEANGTRSQCVCKQGYSGEQCEKVSKDGECPALMRVRENHCQTDRECQQDGHCPGDQKCCYSLKCSKGLCLAPVENFCSYGNRTYDIFESFEPDACTRCRCLTPDPDLPYGGATCSQEMCPPRSRMYRCKRQARREHQCCPVCEDNSDRRPENYKAPVFTNCQPEVVLSLPTSGTVALIEKTLRAVDMNNGTLEVSYSNDSITWQEDLINNFHLIVATARDEWDEVVECSFIVRIRDYQAPVFTYCPSDITATEGDKVRWEPAQAKDNTLLSGSPDADYIPGTVFPPGETLVTYTASDVEGNEEFCQFFVSVEERIYPTTVFTNEIKDRMRGEESIKDEEDEGPKYQYIGMGLGLLIILLLALFGVCVARRKGLLDRNRAENTANRNVEQPPSYDSVIGHGSQVVFVSMDAGKLASKDIQEAYNNPAYSTFDRQMAQNQNISNESR